MTNPLPTPLAAAIGVVPALLSRARRLPGRAVQLPVLAVSHALATMDTFRREYDDLAVRGEALVARLRGQAPGDLGSAEQVYDGGAGTGDATQAVRAATTTTTTATTAATATARATAERAAPAGTSVAAALEDASAAIADISGAPAPVVEDEQPPAAQPAFVRHDTAASSSVQEAVEAAVEEVTAAVDTDVAHDDLPLADYDHMTLGSLRGRLRALSLDQLVQIRAYEKNHADRLPVVTMLDNRIAKLSTDPSAAPSGTVSTSRAPEQIATGGATPSAAVSPATTTAPTINPPSQGDPTNPAQPR